MNVRLHIDRVVLDGVDVAAADRPRLRAAIERELARLIGSGGIAPDLARGAALPRVPAPPVELARGAKPAQLGNAIAGAVYGGIGRSTP
jgi:hypothetical protein